MTFQALNYPLISLKELQTQVTETNDFKIFAPERVFEKKEQKRDVYDF